MKALFLSLTLCTLLWACGDKPAKTTGNSPTQNTTDQQQSQRPQNDIPFKMLPNEIVMDMYENAELLDYIFHSLPFSMSQDEKESIQTNITYIGGLPQQFIPAGCEPIARQFYQIKGEIKYEADVYYSEGCKFYLFYVNGEPSFANQMSTTGQKFFDQMISQAMNTAKGLNAQ